MKLLQKFDTMLFFETQCTYIHIPSPSNEQSPTLRHIQAIHADAHYNILILLLQMHAAQWKKTISQSLQTFSYLPHFIRTHNHPFQKTCQLFILARYLFTYFRMVYHSQQITVIITKVY